MSRTDQDFLELLSSIPSDVRRYSLDIADSVDRHFENVATALRETLAYSTWIPESARPTPPPPRLPPPSADVLPGSVFERAQDWVLRHKVWTAVLVAGVGSTVFLVYRSRKGYSKKRRARRASNGARKEVVVLAGSPTEPISRSLSLDLERRGFIVYVVVNTQEEEQLVQNESRVDIRPLNVNIVDPLSSHNAIERFNQILLHPQHAFPGAGPHNLHLAGVVLIPDTTYPSGPIETISPEHWSDALNVKVLGTIATAQAFLHTIVESKARVLVLTPSIVSSLAPPFHGVESAIVAALEGFTATLRGELRPLGIEVSQFKLGSFDCGAVGGRHHLQAVNATRADVLCWPARTRAAYAKNYVAQSSTVAGQARIKGSPLRELHNAVFDALTGSWPRRVWHVGTGSRTYDVVGRWVPSGVVAWMLGIRRVAREDLGGEEGEGVDWERVERMV